jgi:hypothetical protein
LAKELRTGSSSKFQFGQNGFAEFHPGETTFKSDKPGSRVDANSNSAELAKLRLGRNSQTIVQHCNLNRNKLSIRIRIQGSERLMAKNIKILQLEKKDAKNCNIFLLGSQRRTSIPQVSISHHYFYSLFCFFWK